MAVKYECGVCNRDIGSICPIHGSLCLVEITEPLNEDSVARYNVSLALDAARWVDSYTNHTATALQKRALAAQNGHAK